MENKVQHLVKAFTQMDINLLDVLLLDDGIYLEAKKEVFLNSMHMSVNMLVEITHIYSL